MKRKILIVTTGGTIAMRYDSEHGVVPTNDLVDFLKTFSIIRKDSDIEIFEFSNKPSPFIYPEDMFELAKIIDIKIVDYDGIVITHGTDTLEETAFMLDLVLTTRKPVVLTAAMRSGSDLGLDGPRNIVGAVRVACSTYAKDQGVLVVMNDVIHSARDVTKSDTGRVDTFISMDTGNLGIVDPDRVVFYRKSLIKESVWTDEIETNVDLIKVSAGMDDRYIRTSIENNAKGIVIEAFGRGNVPPKIVPAIKEAVNKNIVVVIVSRSYKGRVLAEYGYEGGGKSLSKIGAILAGDLKGQKARLKLMTLLGKYKDPAVVKTYLTNTYS